MRMKKDYLTPELDITKVLFKDIILASAEGNPGQIVVEETDESSFDEGLI